MIRLLLLVAVLVSAVLAQNPVYTVTSLNLGAKAYTGTLKLTSGKGPYGGDVVDLKFAVIFEDENRVRVRIGDAEEKRWQVPFVIEEPKTSNATLFNYNIKVSAIGSPFALEITRSNGDMLFNTTNRPFIFEDQYLALTTAFTDKHEPNIFGLGERVNSFRLNPVDNTYTMWPQDNGNVGDKNLYGQHPFYLEQRNDGTAHGFFFLNSNALDFVMKYNTAEKYLQIRAIGGIMDFYVFAGPQAKDVVKQYHAIIGMPHRIPYWALGFHQCRWGYKTVGQTKDVVQKYKDNNLPLDTIWNDIDYMRGYRDFTFDPENFPTDQMKQFVDGLHANGQRYIVIVDPGIKVDTDYPPYINGLQRDVYIKKADGKTPIKNKVWPGITVFPDFTNQKAHDYWRDMIVPWLNEVAIDGLWIDMNEVATFCNGECDKQQTPKKTRI